MSAEEFESLVEAMPKIAEAVKLFDNKALQERVLEAMLSSLGVEDGSPSLAGSPSRLVDIDDEPQNGSATAATGRARRRQGGSRRASSSEPTFDKQLSGTPKDKESLKDFLVRCKPKNQHEQVVAITYWLQEIASVTPLGQDQLFTGFKLAGIKVPGAFAGKVSQVGSKGWLKDTTKATVSLSVAGSDHVEHEMLKRVADSAEV